jgi:lysophospholipase L1-like esterase
MSIDGPSLRFLRGKLTYAIRLWRTQIQQQARPSALHLLEDEVFARQVDRLPFQRGETIVGLGDSLTEDPQSWLEILRHLLALRRPQDELRVVNRGISGDTTAQMLTRFIEVANDKPDWLIIFAGTNDARRHGVSPIKTLISPDETKRNLEAIRHYAKTQTHAKIVWMTPASVLTGRISRDAFLLPLQITWRDEDLRAVADIVRALPDPVIDLQTVIGVPPNPMLLQSDGLHFSLEGQIETTKELIKTLT